AEPGAPFPATAKAALRDRVFFNPKPLGRQAKVAFVFPGSGNQFDGMGRDLSAHWPGALRRQHAENERLRDQFAPHLFWADGTAALRPGLLAYLLIVNTPTECVIGGRRADVEKLAAALGKSVHLLEGVTLAHCDAGRPVEVPYRELHTLPAVPPAGVTVYS